MTIMDYTISLNLQATSKGYVWEVSVAYLQEDIIKGETRTGEPLPLDDAMEDGFQALWDLRKDHPKP